MYGPPQQAVNLPAVEHGSPSSFRRSSPPVGSTRYSGPRGGAVFLTSVPGRPGFPKPVRARKSVKTIHHGPYDGSSKQGHILCALLYNKALPPM